VSESGTPERAFAPAAFLTGPNGEPVIVPAPATEKDHLAGPDAQQAPANADGTLGTTGTAPEVADATGHPTDAADETNTEDESDPDDPDDPDDADDPADDGSDDAEDDAEDDAVEDPDDEDEEEEEDERVSRFAELVEERLQRARYAHPLTRAVFTPDELVIAAAVERRAAVWVPVTTVGATVVSAVAAVVLASRLRSDPTDPTGSQLVVVTVTVCLLAAAFGTLLRSEVHYDRLRPRGRTVRTDVADAYEAVRDAPRRLVEADAPAEVLVRVVNLLPVAEQLVDAIVHYTREGGIRVKAHPAYERIVRMRAEVEALEQLLGELETRETSHPRVVGIDGAPLPKPEHVASYRGLGDIADAIESGR
jgi:hypothetical protein